MKRNNRKKTITSIKLELEYFFICYKYNIYRINKYQDQLWNRSDTIKLALRFLDRHLMKKDPLYRKIHENAKKIEYYNDVQEPLIPRTKTRKEAEKEYEEREKERLRLEKEEEEQEKLRDEAEGFY